MNDDFNWQDIIEKNNLLDEKEMNHYIYRKDRLNNMNNENEGDIKTRKGGGPRKATQKNVHIDFDFMTNL
jgi:protoporphyrinogen oxidase